MKISIKKSTSNLPWNYPKLCKHQLLSLKKNKNPHRKLRLALNNTYSGNFLPLLMLKVFIAIVDHFNWQFFFVGNHSGLVAPSTWTCNGFKVSQNNLRSILSNLNFKPPATLKIRRFQEPTLNNLLINTWMWWKFTLPTSCKY